MEKTNVRALVNIFESRNTPRSQRQASETQFLKLEPKRIVRSGLADIFTFRKEEANLDNAKEAASSDHGLTYPNVKKLCQEFINATLGFVTHPNVHLQKLRPRTADFFHPASTEDDEFVSASSSITSFESVISSGENATGAMDEECIDKEDRSGHVSLTFHSIELANSSCARANRTNSKLVGVPESNRKEGQLENGGLSSQWPPASPEIKWHPVCMDTPDADSEFRKLVNEYAETDLLASDAMFEQIFAETFQCNDKVLEECVRCFAKLDESLMIKNEQRKCELVLSVQRIVMKGNQ